MTVSFEMVKKLEALSEEFKTYPCAILDQIEEQEKLAVKNGSDKTLRRLYGTTIQHYRALKAAHNSYHNIYKRHSTFI